MRAFRLSRFVLYDLVIACPLIPPDPFDQLDGERNHDHVRPLMMRLQLFQLLNNCVDGHLYCTRIARFFGNPLDLSLRQHTVFGSHHFKPATIGVLISQPREVWVQVRMLFGLTLESIFDCIEKLTGSFNGQSASNNADFDRVTQVGLQWARL